MSDSASKSHPPSSPPRPGHRLNRSITEVTPPSIKHPHRPHLHSHHHSRTSSRTANQVIPQINTRRARSSEKERDASDYPHSAHPNLQPFLGGDAKWRDGVKSEFGTPAESRNASRRQSVWETGLDGAIVGGITGARKAVREGEVKEERERGVLRAKELKDSLISLHTQSNDTTRRLDMTYYSVLEKLAILQSSITSLKEVSALTRSINTEFSAESTELSAEITTQMENLANFSSQETRIQDLAQRVKVGRMKIKGLGERVEAVRARVEGWESAEGAWQEKTRRRLRVMWILMSLVAGLLIGLVVFGYTPAKTHGTAGVLRNVNATELLGKIPGLDGDASNFTWSMQREKEGEGVLERLRKGQEKMGNDDERLRALDEL